MQPTLMYIVFKKKLHTPVHVWDFYYLRVSCGMYRTTGNERTCVWASCSHPC